MGMLGRYGRTIGLGLVLSGLSAVLSVYGAESPFAIRGTLPWHNFLSGPTAWNLKDYQFYLDWMAERNLNFVGFHCYTGGAERYVNYVEPLIRMEYRNVLPLAEFDTSITSRWGYWPMTTDKFAFGSRRYFKTGKVFGAECAIKAKDNQDRYRRAQDLMRGAIQYAHKKGIRVCLGFEFGIYPPEIFSIIPPDALLRCPYLPDPTHPANIEILDLYISNILEAYPQIDYIWFWLQEMYNPAGKLALSPAFQAFHEENKHFFDSLHDDFMACNGTWSLAYIQKAREILQRRAPQVKMAIGGWGGSTQLPAFLPGLHEALPQDVIFSCLNPNQGWDPQREIMGNLPGREVWIIPWLEGDARLWHPQPRISLLAEQIALARNQNIQGVIGIHWRTEDIRANLDALGLFTTNPPPLDGIRLMTEPEKTEIAQAFYQAWCEKHYGPSAAQSVTPLLVRFDVEQRLAPRRGGVDSPEYFPYEPGWGRLTPDLRDQVQEFLNRVTPLREKETNPTWLSNLDYLENTLRGVLLLDQVGDCLEPAFVLHRNHWAGNIPEADRQVLFREALARWDQAPIRELVEAYGKRIRSPGDLGILSSINQKLWGLASSLREFLERDGK